MCYASSLLPTISIARTDITSALIEVAGLHSSGVSSSMQTPPPLRHVARVMLEPRPKHMDEGRRDGVGFGEVDAQRYAVDLALLHLGGERLVAEIIEVDLSTHEDVRLAHGSRLKLV